MSEPTDKTQIVTETTNVIVSETTTLVVPQTTSANQMIVSETTNLVVSETISTDLVVPETTNVVVSGTTTSTATARIAVPYRAGEMPLPAFIPAELLPLLNAYEQTVYLHFYWLSHGCGSPCCRVGYERLAQLAGVSKSTAIRVIDKLIRLGLVERVSAPARGGGLDNEYRVHLPDLVVTETRRVRGEGERERESLSLSPSRTRARAADVQTAAQPTTPARRARRQQAASRYPLAVRLSFAEWQKKHEGHVRSPLAVARGYGDGAMDEQIAAWQAQQERLARIKAHDEQPCEVCEGLNWEFVPGGKGVRPCRRREAAGA